MKNIKNNIKLGGLDIDFANSELSSVLSTKS